MGGQYNEQKRRQFRRVAIDPDDGIMGFISSPRLIADDSIAVNIINLSAGGLHFFLPKGSFKEICTGDHFTLREIKGTKDLGFIANVELEVKWVAEHRSLEHVGLGCKFFNISDVIRQQINHFVDSIRPLVVAS